MKLSQKTVWDESEYFIFRRHINYDFTILACFFSVNNDSSVLILRRMKGVMHINAVKYWQLRENDYEKTVLTSIFGGAEHRPPGSYLAGGARRHVAYAEGVRCGGARRKWFVVIRRAGCSSSSARRVIRCSGKSFAEGSATYWDLCVGNCNFWVCSMHSNLNFIISSGTENYGGDSELNIVKVYRLWVKVALGWSFA